MMTATELSVVIAAGSVGAAGLITAIGGIFIQYKTLVLTKIGNDKVDANTVITQAAILAQTAGQNQVLAKVSEAKKVSLENSAALSTAVEKITGVSQKIDTVAESSVERLAAAKLAQGTAEGHLAGVVAEQARLAGMTQEVPVRTS